MNETNNGQMSIGDEVQAQSVENCPFHTMQTQPIALIEDDELVCPHYRRMVGQYETGEMGGQEFHIHYGEKDITFDAPELFAFGEGLAEHERFVARDATTWGSGYNWVQVRELLEQLVSEGILRRTDSTSVTGADPRLLQDQARPSPLPLAQTTEPRTWNDCEAITRELTGRSLEVGYLESIIPIYRVAHLALDMEGRQVGEANVFPSQLRLDVPTEWRTCMYKGSRFQDKHPINVTALKSMKAHWKPTMIAVQRIREAYLRRFPAARQGWTVGDLERLSALVLTIPAFLLMRADCPVENGSLHPVLSSMFRVTDGVRMTMHYMLFIDVNEPTRPPEAPMTSGEIYAYAERNAVFLSDHGVCAGPRAMIEEFLRILVDGESVESEESVVLDAAVESALSQIEPAFDYALYGLQAHAVVFSLWSIIARTYERLWAIVGPWSGDASGPWRAFRQQVEEAVTFVRLHTYVGTEPSRSTRDRVFADMYAKSASGLGGTSGRTTLAEHLTPASAANEREVTDRLRSVLRQRLHVADGSTEALLEDLVICLMDYFRQEQAVLVATCEIQERINHLLGRPLPQKPLTGADLYIYYRLQEEGRRPPYLLDVLKDGLDLHVVVTKETIDIEECVR